MKKRILLIGPTSGYDVLSVFLREICAGFESQGYEIEELDYSYRRSMLDLINRPLYSYEFIFSINSGLLEKIAFVLPATTPAVAFLVDRPIEQDGRLKNTCLSYLASNVSRDWVQYADRFYKNINRNMFIPHGGSKAEADIPYESRTYNVVFFGGYTNPNKIMQEMNALPGTLPDFNIQLINIMLSDETISWEKAIEQVCTEHGLALTEQQLHELGNKTIQADVFFRMYLRETLLKNLADAGIEVDVFGNGWEDLEYRNNSCLRIHKPVRYPEALNIMADSKIVLNIAPTLNAGSHERIFSAMMNGAVCFTNYSSYLQEAGIEKMVIPYSIHNLEAVPQMVRLILSKPVAAREIAARAQKCALENHTWVNRARDIIAMVETYKQEMHYEKASYKNHGELQFWELCRFIRENTYELLLEKMKCVVHNFLEDSNGCMRRALQSYNTYGYWGGCLREEGDYELLENRAHALKEHLDDFIWMHDHLEDEKSKAVLYAVMRHWLDYIPMHLMKVKETVYEQYFDYDIISCTEEEVFVDLGAYTGDTVLGYLKNYGNYKRIYCYDIDNENLDICRENLKLFENIEYRHCAVGDKNGYIYMEKKLDTSANSISKTGEERIPMVSLDEDITETITFLKMDIEGSEQTALMGAREHIIKDHPKMAISIYHNNEDIWKIGKIIHEMDGSYRFYMRYYGDSLYPNEYVLYAV